MHSSDDPRHHRGFTRAALTALAGSLLLTLVLGSCSPDSEEAPAPVADGETSPAADPSSPSDQPSPTGVPLDQPSPTDVPSDEPSPTGVPSDDPSEADPPPADGSSTDGWQAPTDPTVEGPTEAPVLPEVHGNAEEDISLPTGIVVSLSAITTTTIKGETPGEYSGPAVIVEVQLDNDSEEAQDVNSAVVSLVADDGEAGVPTWASPYEPLQGEVPAGGSAAGTYVFMLDPAPQRAVTVSVNPAAGEPLAVFAGKTS